MRKVKDPNILEISKRLWTLVFLASFSVGCATKTSTRKLPPRVLTEPKPKLKRPVDQGKLNPTQKKDQELPVTPAAYPWAEAIPTAVQGANKIRVRSGGHRFDPTKEKIHFEKKGTKVVLAVLALIEINADESHFVCMCYGGPSLDFYKDKTLLLSVGLHHGQSLRWKGAPSDAALTSTSAIKLATWLSKNGVQEPLKTLKAKKAANAANEGRQMKMSKLLPKTLRSLLTRNLTAEEALKKIEKEVPDAMQRAALAFRLLGCDNASWYIHSGLDDFVLYELLPTLETQDLAEAIRTSKDRALRNGAARAMLEEQLWRDLSTNDRKDLLPPLIQFGLAHPRSENRRNTLAEAVAIGDELGVLGTKALRTFFEHRASPKPPQNDNGHDVYDEPDGQAVAIPRKFDCAASERACAALALAKLGDQQSIGQITAFAKKTKSKIDAAIYSQAQKLLAP